MANREISDIREYIGKFGTTTFRERGRTIEKLGLVWELNPKNYEFKPKNEDDTKEMKDLSDMVKDQIHLVETEYERNHMSRRIMLQFDRFFYDDPSYIICIESVYYFFHSKKDYTIIINFRSSDVDKLERDVAIIKKISQNILKGKNIKTIRIHCCNAHKYV